MVLRCAALATHPAALDARSYWIENSTKATLWLADALPRLPSPRADRLELSDTLSVERTSELDDGRHGNSAGRFRRSCWPPSAAVAQTVGEGVVAVELEGEGRSVLRPDVDLQNGRHGRTTRYRWHAQQGWARLRGLDAVQPLSPFRYGWIRAALRLRPDRTCPGRSTHPFCIHFRYAGVIRLTVRRAPVQFDSDMTLREPIPGMGAPSNFGCIGLVASLPSRLVVRPAGSRRQRQARSGPSRWPSAR